MSSAVYSILLLASLFQLQAVSVYQCKDCNSTFERRTTIAKIGLFVFVAMMIWVALNVLFWILQLAAYYSQSAN